MTSKESVKHMRAKRKGSVSKSAQRRAISDFEKYLEEARTIFPKKITADFTLKTVVK